MNIKKIFTFLLILIPFFLVVYFVFINKSKKTEVSQQQLTPSLFNPDQTAPLNNVNPIARVSTLEDGKIYGIDKKDGSLIGFENNEQITIYEGKVKDYSIKENTAIVLDNQDLSKIIVINLSTKSRREISLESYSPIISATLSDDLKTIYFLSNFDISTKLPKLNSVSINGGEPKEILETKAQSIRYLKNNILILFVENHAENKNDFILFDINKNKIVLSKATNSFQVSPDKNHIALQKSNRIEVLDTNTLGVQFKTIEISSRSSWKDNNTLIIFKNDNRGLNYSVLTINPFELSPFTLLVENIVMQTSYGFLNNVLYWQGYDENIYQTPIDIID